MKRRHFLENRIPPALVALIVAAAMVVASRLYSSLRLQTPALVFLGVVLGVSGFIVSLVGVATFERHRTTLNPFRPETASTLVTSGIFGRTRNPIYVGVTLSLAGLGVGLGHPLALVLVPLFPLYIQRFQIAPEERAMEALFGEAFAAYKMRVPRWL